MCRGGGSSGHRRGRDVQVPLSLSVCRATDGLARGGGRPTSCVILSVWGGRGREGRRARRGTSYHHVAHIDESFSMETRRNAWLQARSPACATTRTPAHPHAVYAYASAATGVASMVLQTSRWLVSACA